MFVRSQKDRHHRHASSRTGYDLSLLPRRAHKTLLIDGRSAVESVFALLLARVTEPNSAAPNFRSCAPLACCAGCIVFRQKIAAFAAYQIGVICIEQRTLSGCFGRGDLNHNNRSIITENVHEDRIRDDIIICQRSLKQLYHELFDDALAEFNARQTRRDRKIANYQEHIRHSRQEKEFYEVLFQVGNREDTGLDSDMCKEAAEVLAEYARTFQERNPHLIVFNAVVHMDESTPHLHLDFVPVSDEARKNGMRVRNSLTGALRQQGLSGKGISRTITIDWLEREKEHIGQLMLEHGIEWVKLGTKEEHLSVKDYKLKKRQEEIEQKTSELDEIQQELDKAAKKKVKIAEIESIEAKESMFGKKVTLSREDYDKLNDTAKKYVAMEKSNKKLKKERDTAVQERDELKAEYAAVSSELADYKKKEEEKALYSRKKLNSDAKRISKEDQLTRSLRKALAVIDAHGLRYEYEHIKLNTAQKKTVLE